ncbi:hypothetical protein V496_03203 [Pseudogymnoascus sp. VKM F-4515 (FW-2607)]|nr:hypothetical protein V496_03203 [Pseudogymnoascus sp. VKM F-4515 (FW-2607)]KFY96527.1 hypothetical protein V498_02623 [Pseudogymnoascus sp. VKM F-4517 (FW-2822)]
MAPHAVATTEDILVAQADNVLTLDPKPVKAAPEPSVGNRLPLGTLFPPLVIEEHPIDEVPRLKVVVVGAGIAGVNAGILLPRKVPDIDLVILERHADLGGTWHTNVYPGVKCDIPSDVYQSTFAPQTNWSENYSPGAEIQAYWKKVAQKYDTEKYIKYGTSVTRADWSDEKSKWVLQIVINGVEAVEEADFLITATGHFSDPRLPNYPGRDEYEGHLVHTSLWDPAYEPAGKRIAVIGNGASGLQIVPQLQKLASHLDHYARSKTWIAGSFTGEELHRGPGRTPPPQDPEAYLKHRKKLEEASFSRFSTIIKGGETNAKSKEAFTKLMSDRLGDRIDLLEKLKPDFSPNCRRLTPGPGYLEAITQPNVGHISTPISHFTKTGIALQDGTTHDYDAIVCSTGADTTFAPHFPIVANGINLQTSWRPGAGPEHQPGFPDTYLGIGAPQFPNFLQILGPNSTGLGGTIPHAIETQVTYAAKILRKVSTQGIRTITPSVQATNEFRAYCESFFPRTVMSETCSSWYNGGIAGGRIHGIWPGSGTHAVLARRDPRWEDFDYTYRNEQGNRFAWFGNGWTAKDVRAANGEEDLNFTPYLKVESVTGELDLKTLHEDGI